MKKQSHLIGPLILAIFVLIYVYFVQIISHVGEEAAVDSMIKASGMISFIYLCWAAFRINYLYRLFNEQKEKIDKLEKEIQDLENKDQH